MKKSERLELENKQLRRRLQESTEMCTELLNEVEDLEDQLNELKNARASAATGYQLPTVRTDN